LEKSEIEKEPIDEEFIPIEQNPLRRFNSVKSKKKDLNSTSLTKRMESRANSENSSSNYLKSTSQAVWRVEIS
jgi:hypothetical protein